MEAFLGYQVDWTLTWQTVTALATLGLLSGAFISAYLVYRGHRNDQLYRFAQQHDERSFFERFWLAELGTRGKWLAVTPFQSVHLVLPMEHGGEDAALFHADVSPEPFPTALRDVVLDLFGPGYATDGMRSDLIAYRVLVSRLCFWAGTTSPRRRRLIDGRVAQVLRVFGEPLVASMTSHVLLVSRTGWVAEVSDVKGSLYRAKVVRGFYVAAYGLADPVYLEFGRALVRVVRTKGFVSSMSESALRLEQALDGIPCEQVGYEAELVESPRPPEELQ